MLTQLVSPATFEPCMGGLPKEVSLLGRVRTLITGKENIEPGSIAILGVGEDRNSSRLGCSESPNRIRTYLYSLASLPAHKTIWDLGNLIETRSPADTYAALQMAVGLALEKQITLVILGGTQELTLPVYRALSEQQNNNSLAIVDSRIDMEPGNSDFSPSSFLNPLIQENREKLYCLNLIGFQGYLTNPESIRFLESKHHELYRLGHLRGGIEEVEPAFRNSHIASFDLSAIRQSDSPAGTSPSPNGLYAEEACQLGRYAGLSDNMKVFGIFELGSHNDKMGQSAHLAAQVAWHFIDGFFSRRKAEGKIQDRKFKRFYVKSPIPNVDMIFLKDTLTQSWWMELTSNTEGENATIVACTHGDYLAASNGDIPDRWLRASSRMI